MTAEQKLQFVKQWYVDMLGIGRSEAIADYFSTDYVNYVLPAPEGGWKRGVVGAQQIIEIYRSSFPDLTIEIEDQIIKEDKIVTRYRATGTHTGKPFFGLAATGKKYVVSGMGIEEIVDNKISKSWGGWDAHGLMQQMGILPAVAERVG